MRKSSNITMTDLFCGCGGSSSGAMEAAESLKLSAGIDVELKLALNHWKRAIETHQTNFPNTYHEATDIQACEPRRYVSTNILMASPECTNHSLAKGQKRVKEQLGLYDKAILDPSAERSRATMWDVPRFAEVHQYDYIITENVCDAYKWCMFPAWIRAMECLNYEWNIVSLNSMFCWPTPQSRDRMYVVFWRKGRKKPDLRIMPRAYCPKCNKDVDSLQRFKNGRRVGKYKQQYDYCCPVCATAVEPYYYAAFNAIDWSDLGTRIGDRKKDLSPNTRRRIQYGLDKYGEPFTINNQQSTGVGFRTNPVTGKMPTQSTQQSISICNPFIVNSQYSPERNNRVKSAYDKLNTITGSHPEGICTPFLSLNEHTKTEPQVRSSMDAMQTQTTRQSMALIVPFIVENKGLSKSRGIDKPLGCVTSKDYHGLLTPESIKSFLSYYYNGSDCASHITEASGTVTANDRIALIGAKPKIEDCYYRMLKPKEIQKAMAFADDFIITGNSKDQVKQAGNAVTPPAMRILQERVLACFL